MLAIEALIEEIEKKNNPTCVGLDTSFEYLPEGVRLKLKTLEDAAEEILAYNIRLIDRLAPVIPSVKVQVAYYEMLGWQGMKAFYYTLKYAKEKGLITIADVKRNDIGATAEAYSKAYFSGVSLNGGEELLEAGFPSDFITVNGYLGSDGILPFVKDAKKYGKGLFVLVKTSNPGSAELQNKELAGGGTLFEEMGGLVSDWGDGLVSKYGYSSVGAVVGATHPQEAAVLRKSFSNTFFLIPGYGAQGGTAQMLKACFDERGGGGIVNNSRGIIAAYKKDKYKGMDYADAAYEAAVEMKLDLEKALKG